MMEKDFFTEKEFFCTLNSPVVQTKAGKLRGFRYGSTYTFYGIRYAHAKRFRMPEEPEPSGMLFIMVMSVLSWRKNLRRGI